MALAASCVLTIPWLYSLIQQVLTHTAHVSRHSLGPLMVFEKAERVRQVTQGAWVEGRKGAHLEAVGTDRKLVWPLEAGCGGSARWGGGVHSQPGAGVTSG